MFKIAELKEKKLALFAKFAKCWKHLQKIAKYFELTAKSLKKVAINIKNCVKQLKIAKNCQNLKKKVKKNCKKLQEI